MQMQTQSISRHFQQALRQLKVIALHALWAAMAFGMAQPTFASRPNNEGARIESLLQFPSDPHVMFAAGEGLYKSVDAGRTWKPLPTPWGLRWGLQVAADADEPDKIILFQSTAATAPREYLESIDSGATWVSRTTAGTVLGNARFSNPTRVQGAFYRADGKHVSKSMDGVNWTPLPWALDVPIARLAVFRTGVFMARTSNGWFKGSEREPWVATPFLSPYELRYVNPGAPGTRPGNRDYCFPRMSPANEMHLFATCTDKNIGGGISIDFGAQLRSTDGGNTWARIKGESLPRTWFPTAVALHPSDPQTLVMTWISGRIFRSADSGETWQPSDQGLVFPERLRNLPEYGVPYLYETPLIQALLINDFSAISKLAADGADLSAKGALGKTALEWAFELDAEGWPHRQAFYWKLRALGAKPHTQSGEANDSLLARAASRNKADIVEDLLRSGWRLTSFPFASDCPTPRTATCQISFAGLPIEHWVKLQLSLAAPGESAQMVLNLVNRQELQLANTVLAFDAGHYKQADLHALLTQLPSEQASLKSSILKSHARSQNRQFRGLTGEQAADLVKVLFSELKNPALAKQVLRENRNALSDEAAGDLIGIFLLANRLDLALVVDPKRSPRTRDEFVYGLLTGCDVRLLNRGLQTGSRVTDKSNSEASAMRIGLYGCREHSETQTDRFVERLHRLGLRLNIFEWLQLEPEERAALLRSSERRRYEKFADQTGGVGLSMDEAWSDYPTVKSIIEGFPAAQAGIQPGDRLLAVDSNGLKAKSISDATSHLRGKPGTLVKVTVQRGAEPARSYVIRRQSLVSVP